MSDAEIWKGGDRLALSLMTWREVQKAFGKSGPVGAISHESKKTLGWVERMQKLTEVYGFENLRSGVTNQETMGPPGRYDEY
jgi:hypothetical protein